MKRSRRRVAPTRTAGITVEANVAGGAPNKRPPRGNRYQRMKLPHERDESTTAPQPPGAVTEQAARDVEQGKSDTDEYGKVGQRFDRLRDQR